MNKCSDWLKELRKLKFEKKIIKNKEVKIGLRII
jgi:hypothetical protein